MEKLSVVSEHGLLCGAMDTVMELYETLYQGLLHPERVLFASVPILSLYRKLIRFFGAQKAYTIFLFVWDEVLHDSDIGFIVKGDEKMNEPDSLPPAPTLPITHITAFPIAVPEFRDLLIRQGCWMEEQTDRCIIHFPAGTTRTEIYPRSLSERFIIRFPSGTEVIESFELIAPESAWARSIGPY